MGLGKTIQALAHLLVEKEAGRLDRPALVVAPTSLMGNWRREAARFAPALRTLVLHGSDRHEHFDAIPDHDLVLTTYPLLPRDQARLQDLSFHSLILDEAQTVKNPKSQAAGVVRALKADHRLCLTGTPMENHLGELWAQFDFLMPGFLGDATNFKRHWRTPIEQHQDRDRHQRLARRIAPFMLRRRKQDVATELPPKTEIIKSVTLGEAQATLYEGIRLSMEKRVRDAIASPGPGAQPDHHPRRPAEAAPDLLRPAPAQASRRRPGSMPRPSSNSSWTCCRSNWRRGGKHPALLPVHQHARPHRGRADQARHPLRQAHRPDPQARRGHRRPSAPGRRACSSSASRPAAWASTSPRPTPSSSTTPGGTRRWRRRRRTAPTASARTSRSSSTSWSPSRRWRSASSPCRSKKRALADGVYREGSGEDLGLTAADLQGLFAPLA